MATAESRTASASQPIPDPAATLSVATNKPNRTGADGVTSAENNEDGNSMPSADPSTNDATVVKGTEAVGKEEGELLEGIDKENVSSVVKEGESTSPEQGTKDGPSPTSSPPIIESPSPVAANSTQTPPESTSVSTNTPSSTPPTSSTPAAANPATPRQTNKQQGAVKSSSCLSGLFSCFGSSSTAENFSDDEPTEKKVAKSKNSKNGTTPAVNASKPTENGIPVAPLPSSPDANEATPSPPTNPSDSSASDSPHSSPPDHIPSIPTSTLAAATVAATVSSGVVLSQEETEGVTSGAVVPPGKGPGRRPKRGAKPVDQNIITSVPEPGMPMMKASRQRTAGDDSEDESGDESEDDEEESEDEEQSLIARGGVGIPIGEDGLPHPLLDEISADLKGRKCLVLDLDETLVHSSFKQMVHQADYVVPVEIENQYHNVYVIKRPGVDAFLKAMGEIYEVVIFTASLSKYADPVLDQLDIHRVVKHRLFRESCYNNKGNYVKDLSQLGRPMSDCIIIDNSPASYVFHPNNAVPISSWFNDPHDTELTDLVPFLTDLERVEDVRGVLDAGLYQDIQLGSLSLVDEVKPEEVVKVQ